MTADRIGLLIDRLPELQGINRQVRRLLALQHMLTEVVPGNLAASTTLALSATNALVLFTDSGAIAAKLKLLAPRIVDFIRQHGHEVTAIRVQVQVKILHNPLPQKKLFLSPVAREALSELSSTLDISPLKSALERLSSRKIRESDRNN